MQKHTPGPWVAGFGDTEELGSVYGVGLTTKPDWTVICVVSKAVDVTDQDIANARLIAAAPDLLAELKKARLYIAGRLSVFLGEISENVAPDPLLNFAAQRDQSLLDSIDAAIAKAIGEQS